MDYTALRLRELAPLLKESVQRASAPLKIKGQQLIAASQQITRFGDLMSPFIGAQVTEELISAYLIPQIQSYINEVAGHGKTLGLINFMPATAVAAKAGVFGNLANVFGGALK